MNWTGSRSAHVCAIPAVAVALVFTMAAAPHSLVSDGGFTVMQAQAPGEAKTMTEAQLGKLDAVLKRAVADKRPEPFSVMIRLATEPGADARVVELLAKLGLKVSRTLSGGRLLLVTLKTAQLPDVTASADVAHVSFDAVVKPQAK